MTPWTNATADTIVGALAVTSTLIVYCANNERSRAQLCFFPGTSRQGVVERVRTPQRRTAIGAIAHQLKYMMAIRVPVDAGQLVSAANRSTKS
eukprot:6851942-Prymnesium_polylepis.1